MIINDGSTDNTEDVVKSFRDKRIKYIVHPNQGVSATVNRGVKQAQGDFIIRLDSDDMMTPDYISKHIQQFINHPDADMIYCDDYLIDENAKPIRIIERQQYNDRTMLIYRLVG